MTCVYMVSMCTYILWVIFVSCGIHVCIYTEAYLYVCTFLCTCACMCVYVYSKIHLQVWGSEPQS